MHTYEYMDVSLHTYISTNTHVYPHACMAINIHKYIYMHLPNCMYINMHNIYVYAYTHTDIHTHRCMDVYIYAYKQTLMHTLKYVGYIHIHVCLHTYIFKCIQHIYMYALVCKWMHTYIHTDRLVHAWYKYTIRHTPACLPTY